MRQLEIASWPSLIGDSTWSLAMGNRSSKPVDADADRNRDRNAWQGNPRFRSDTSTSSPTNTSTRRKPQPIILRPVWPGSSAASSAGSQTSRRRGSSGVSPISPTSVAPTPPQSSGFLAARSESAFVEGQWDASPSLCPSLVSPRSRLSTSPSSFVIQYPTLPRRSPEATSRILPLSLIPPLPHMAAYVGVTVDLEPVPVPVLVPVPVPVPVPIPVPVTVPVQYIEGTGEYGGGGGYESEDEETPGPMNRHALWESREPAPVLAHAPSPLPSPVVAGTGRTSGIGMSGTSPSGTSSTSGTSHGDTGAPAPASVPGTPPPTPWETQRPLSTVSPVWYEVILALTS